MLPLSEIICLVSALAAGNNTDDLLPTVVSFIETYYNDFPMDFIPCKNVLNGRFKKGKLEEILTRKSAYQIRFCIFIDTKNFEMKFFI